MKLFAVLIALFTFVSCKQNTADSPASSGNDTIQSADTPNEFIDKESKEANYIEQEKPEIKKVTNTRFDF